MNRLRAAVSRPSPLATAGLRADPRPRAGRLRPKQAHPTVADANNNGGYVDAGPVTYQLQVSRRAQPVQHRGLPVHQGPARRHDAADARPAVVRGVPVGQEPDRPRPQTTTDNFVIVDTQGNTYYPFKLNPTPNPYAWTLADAGPAADRARPGHHRQLRPHPGRAPAVQDRQLGLRQPAADPQDLRRRRPATISLDCSWSPEPLEPVWARPDAPGWRLRPPYHQYVGSPPPPATPGPPTGHRSAQDMPPRCSAAAIT